MKRVGLVLVVILLAVTGCGSKKPTAGPTPTSQTTSGATTSASPSGSPTPSGSPADLFEFSVDGAGPYKLGLTLTALQASPGLTNVGAATTCPGNTVAHGKGTWGDIELDFHNDGKLYLAVNKSINVPTPSGVYLGASLADVKRIYVGVSGQQLTHGADSAYLVVTLGGGGILFVLDPTQKVTSMVAGDSSLLRSSFQGGTNYC
jgi:hypothetical protein